MAASSPWPLIHSERTALADDLATLTQQQWTAASLCGDWSVRDALGHMIATARMTPPRFFAALAGAGFSFNAMTAKGAARYATGPPAAELAEFRRCVDATTHPPEAVIRVADFYKGSNLLIGSKKRIAGLRLRATDAEWSTGAGPEVSGPALSLLLAMTGRAAALDDLSGDGLATLRERT